MKFSAFLLLMLLGACAAPRPGEKPAVPPHIARPLQRFLEGSQEERKLATRELTELGGEALPYLVHLRNSGIPGGDHGELAAMIFEIKKARLKDRDARRLFWKLEVVTLRIEFKNTRVDTILDTFREQGTLQIFLAPSIRETVGWQEINLKSIGAPFREIFDHLCMRFGLDYDYRYGLLWIGPVVGGPSRFPGNLDPATNEIRERARELVQQLGEPNLQKRLQAMDELEVIGPDAREAIWEGIKDPEPEVAARSRMMLKKLKLSRLIVSIGLPSSNQWTRQILNREEEWNIAKNLHFTFHSLKVRDSRLDVILDLISEMTGISFVVDISGRPTGMQSLSLQVREIRLRHIIELLTLPYGLDARIAGNVVEIYVPEKK